MMTVCLSFVQDMENHDEDDGDSVSFFLFCRMWRIMKMTVCISVQDVENDDNVSVQDMEIDDSVYLCRTWRMMTMCVSVQDVENDDNVCICAGRGE